MFSVYHSRVCAILAIPVPFLGNSHGIQIAPFCWSVCILKSKLETWSFYFNGCVKPTKVQRDTWTALKIAKRWPQRVWRGLNIPQKLSFCIQIQEITATEINLVLFLMCFRSLKVGFFAFAEHIWQSLLWGPLQQGSISVHWQMLSSCVIVLEYLRIVYVCILISFVTEYRGIFE